MSDPYVIEAYKAAVDVIAASPSLRSTRRQMTPADAAARLIRAMQGMTQSGTRTDVDDDGGGGK